MCINNKWLSFMGWSMLTVVYNYDQQTLQLYDMLKSALGVLQSSVSDLNKGIDRSCTTEPNSKTSLPDTNFGTPVKRRKLPDLKSRFNTAFSKYNNIFELFEIGKGFRSRLAMYWLSAKYFNFPLTPEAIRCGKYLAGITTECICWDKRKLFTVGTFLLNALGFMKISLNASEF
ncbi:hypothetical protein TPHA_0G00110 [Tetrapisispora phaffii CBS 4417]|uniref:Uncharacterized protein n=1 Tax=Tetrapisispora phaffii (strain ATCC 24235 / CBS 4417 / NBRC 1672 / NRRL Y-8282 / UCD 70-5) TaxID=1071381 RepID=G8BVC4_TETPH|nr:hypothetical protein TPHA_0G00110 [Tetrapisispora phaffii CBS 4417]CCE63852.1 hypothetical protein TPHA_0G00110 [Tetrapisispora phaffii CBS 4417]